MAPLEKNPYPIQTATHMQKLPGYLDHGPLVYGTGGSNKLSFRQKDIMTYPKRCEMEKEFSPQCE